MYEQYTKLSNVIENVVFIVLDVNSMKPVLCGQPVLGGQLAIH